MDNFETLRNYLGEQGHSAEQVEHILQRLREFDRKMVNESVFDSIESGQFNLQHLIDEALNDFANGVSPGSVTFPLE